MVNTRAGNQSKEDAIRQRWVALYRVGDAEPRRIDAFYADPGAGTSRCLEMALPMIAQANGTLLGMVRALDVAAFLAALRDDRGIGELIHAVGRYAVEKGAAWRVGEGAEIMEAYQAMTVTSE